MEIIKDQKFVKTYKGGDFMIEDKIKEQIDKKIGPKRIRKRKRIRDQIKKRDDAPIVHCVCPNCGAKVPNKAEIPCDLIMCPQCGSTMRKE
jgi:hypothetical protein